MPAQLQSALGDAHQRNRFDHNIGGYLMVGRVTKVWHRKHTADVTLITSQGSPMGHLRGSETTEGAFACRILESYAGFDSEMGKPFGNITPIQEGCTVLVGFVNNMKEQPVILGCLHSTSSVHNNLTDFYPIYSEKLAYECLKMNRLQDYFYQDGSGQIEIALHTKSFITSSCTHELSDARDGFNYDDLMVKGRGVDNTCDLNDGSPPLDWLAVFRDKFDDTVSKCIKFLLSVSKGMFRITKDTNEDKLTFIELNENGDFRIRQQLDSYTHDSGEHYTEFKVGSDGTVNIEQSVEGKKNFVTVTPNGITIENSGNLTVKAPEVTVKANTITLNTEEE